ncbi:MAG: orotidine-5'-phosphate decarboxylase [Rothia sp. (in: high G+C Gram-positive bacteria)]|uniref:orotidine-5'-phosphate decarboxylase n=1 Tax=Rothia sp. (in: high G+C Gram-positive bacteria) TaxID=1885016 RepID=UPI00270078F7|nr:orotidine-5'-phosphate decarboxylase [Rothia sp. (in: high G+C Gram-positive bacteria)]
MSRGFGDRLAAAMGEKGPLCVGIDPHPSLLEAWGLPDAAASLSTFATAVLEACGPVAAALKPQVALFERHGSAGLAALEQLQRDATDAGVLVVADAKRGDIGSTMAAYADAWLGEASPLGTDSVTLSPYLGFESLRPALDLADRNNRGTFVLALTSNPEGQTVQHVGGSSSVASLIIEVARAENDQRQWEAMGPCGLVVGATVAGALKKLEIDLSTFNGPILAPGFGAQGATARDLYTVFSGIESQVLVNSSRGVLAAGPSAAGLRLAAEKARDELLSAR